MAVLAAILVVALPANAAVGVLDHAQITLANNDNVVVVTVNNQLRMVMKITPLTTSDWVASGCGNHYNDGSDEQMTFSGWSHGGNNHNSNDNED